MKTNNCKISIGLMPVLSYGATGSKLMKVAGESLERGVILLIVDFPESYIVDESNRSGEFLE